jgi:photosystem II stability/assembly factor-like uncharacterized protein
MGATAILSPNGQQTTRGEGPATGLLVATLKGVMRLERPAVGAAWAVAAQSLAERHVSAMLLEPGSGKLFAGAHGEGGVWVSDDGLGSDWRPVANGLDRTNVYALAGRRVGNAVTIFAGVEPAALYRSDDLGRSWRELPALRGVPGTDKWTFPPPPHIAHVKCITLHPSRLGTIYACVEQGALLKSDDDGASWVELDGYVRPDDVTYRDTHRIEIHPRRHEVLYLTTGLGLNRSTDGGRSWAPLSRRSDRLGYPDFLAFDPHNPEVMFMSGAARPPGDWLAQRTSDSALLKSTDGGRSWQELRKGLPHPMVGSIEALGAHEWAGGWTLTMATSTGELYASDDAGESWTCVAQGLPPVSKAGHYRAFLPETQPRKGLAAFA